MWARTGLPVGGEEVWEQEMDGGGRAGGARLLAVPPSWPLLPCPDHSQGSAWPMLRSSVGVTRGEGESSLLSQQGPALVLVGVDSEGPG